MKRTTTLLAILLFSIDVSFAQSFSCGREHTAFLCSDNFVHGWGRNDVAQLGDSSSDNRTIPVETKGKHRFIQVATGDEHTYALKLDGTVWGWGRAAEGQLGWYFAGPIHYYRTGPTQWRNTSGIKAIKIADTKGKFSMAMRDDSLLYAWGENIYGQLGDGTYNSKQNYVQITSAGKVSEIVGGFDHALVLKPDSTMMSVGYNKVGQLGDGGTSPRTSYGVVDSIDSVIAIDAGAYFSVALRADGTVWTWGINGRGQLGNGTTNNHPTPRQVPGLSDITAIAAGDQHMLALKADSTVVAWGGNDYGQLGDSSFSNRHTPIAVKRLYGVIAIEAGGGHSAAITADSAVVSWGRSNSGQMGNCDTSVHYTTFDTTQLGCMYCPDVIGKPFGWNANVFDVTFVDSSLNYCTTTWDLGDGNISTDHNFTHSYANPGSYYVCQILESSCGNDTVCDSVHVYCPLPISAFSHSGTSSTISFQDQSTDVTGGWVWSFGDGGQDTVQHPTYNYGQAGNFKVCLIVENTCGKDTICENIDVRCTLPIPGFSSAVNGLDVQFTDGSDSASSVSWDFGDGQSDTTFSPLHSYDSAGSYMVCQTVSSDCADSTQCEEVNVVNTSIGGRSAFGIYPNPAKDKLQIPSTERIFALSLYDVKGKKVIHQDKLNSMLIQLDLSNLNDGIYLLEISTESGVHKEKIVLAH